MAIERGEGMFLQADDFKVGDRVWTTVYSDFDAAPVDTYMGHYKPNMPWSGIITNVSNIGRHASLYTIREPDAGFDVTVDGSEFWRTQKEAEDGWRLRMENYVCLCEKKLDDARSDLKKGPQYANGENTGEEDVQAPGF